MTEHDDIAKLIIAKSAQLTGLTDILAGVTPEPEFVPFPKLPRLARGIIISEKIDGTNAQVFISEDLQTIRAGSRTRWISPLADNFGFAKWVEANKEELLELGPGRHFGEWWGQGIQRGYGLTERRFSLFNSDRWQSSRPACCSVAPVLYRGEFTTEAIEASLKGLELHGSRAALGFPNPEGIVVFHKASNSMFKKTIDRDEEPKGKTK